MLLVLALGLWSLCTALTPYAASAGALQGRAGLVRICILSSSNFFSSIFSHCDKNSSRCWRGTGATRNTQHDKKIRR